MNLLLFCTHRVLRGLRISVKVTSWVPLFQNSRELFHNALRQEVLEFCII
jgi:hypothetical protein